VRYAALDGTLFHIRIFPHFHSQVLPLDNRAGSRAFAPKNQQQSVLKIFVDAHEKSPGLLHVPGRRGKLP
jgi:hypothetical protein